MAELQFDNPSAPDYDWQKDLRCPQCMRLVERTALETQAEPLEAKIAATILSGNELVVNANELVKHVTVCITGMHPSVNRQGDV